MRINPTFTGFEEFCTAGDKTEPSSGLKASGYLPLEMLPAQHFNWLLNRASKGVTETELYVDNINKELNSVLASAGISPDNSTSQLLSALNLLYGKTAVAVSSSTYTVTEEGVYLINYEDCAVTLSSSLPENSRVVLFAFSNFRLVQSASQSIAYLEAVATTVGTGGYLPIQIGESISLIARKDKLVRNPTTLTQWSTPLYSGASVAYAVDVSKDGSVIAIGLNTSSDGSLIVLKRTGTTWTSLTVPTRDKAIFKLALSPEGNYVAVAGPNPSPFYVYSIGPTSLTLLLTESTPLGTFDCAISSNGLFVVTVFGSASPYMKVWRRFGSTYTLLANPTTLPTSQIRSCAISENGKYVYLGGTASPYIYAYKLAGTTYTKLANPATLPAGAVYAIACTPDGATIAAQKNSANTGVLLYRLFEDVFTYIGEPDLAVSALTTTAAYLAFSRDGRYLIHGTYNTSPAPGVTVYKMGPDGSATRVVANVSAVSSALCAMPAGCDILLRTIIDTVSSVVAYDIGTVVDDVFVIEDKLVRDNEAAFIERFV